MPWEKVECFVVVITHYTYSNGFVLDLEGGGGVQRTHLQFAFHALYGVFTYDRAFVCVFVRVFIKSHMTARSEPVILVILCHSH